MINFREIDWLSSRCQHASRQRSDRPSVLIINLSIWASHRTGIAETFHHARVAFQRAWVELAATLAEANYEIWRRQRDWTAWKDRMHDLALPFLGTVNSYGIQRCLP